jgi:hypothetical protein
MLILTGVTSPWISGREADGGKVSFKDFNSSEQKRKGGINWADFGIHRIR